jgi:type IV pilus assembly protein PilC
MPVFQYIALDSQGVEIKNEIEALSQKEAISKIRNMGYFPTKVAEKGAGKKETAKKASAKTQKRRGANSKVKVKQLTQFARQLSTLQDAGLPILRSLRILEEQEKKGAFKRIIGYVGDDIEGGSTLSEAMGKYPRAFDKLFVSMVAAGETGGVLDLILSRLAEFMEKAQKLKARVKGAMIYPVVVMFMALVIVMGLMLFVVPNFAGSVAEMTEGGKLPTITLTIMAISNWIAYQYGWAWMIGIPIGLVMAINFVKRFRVGRLVIDTIVLRLPIMGQISGKGSITRWTRTLGTLISAGVPILDAINVTRETAGNEVFANVLGRIYNSIRQGDTFAGPLKQCKQIDLIVSNMVAVGEETGDLDKMLLKTAENFDEQVDVLVGSLMHMIEPLMVVGLGSIVGTIVISIFAPMISIMQSLSGSGG